MVKKSASELTWTRSPRPLVLRGVQPATLAVFETLEKGDAVTFPSLSLATKVRTNVANAMKRRPEFANARVRISKTSVWIEPKPVEPPA